MIGLSHYLIRFETNKYGLNDTNRICIWFESWNNTHTWFESEVGGLNTTGLAVWFEPEMSGFAKSWIILLHRARRAMGAAPLLSELRAVCV